MADHWSVEAVMADINHQSKGCSFTLLSSIDVISGVVNLTSKCWEKKQFIKYWFKEKVKLNVKVKTVERTSQ